MKQNLKRVRLKSLSDVQRVMADLFKFHRNEELSDGQLNVLSQHLNRLHTQMVASKELDISEDLLLIEQKLADLEVLR